MDKKNQQSKSQFGTLTATSDANKDYANSPSSTATTKSIIDDVEENSDLWPITKRNTSGQQTGDKKSPKSGSDIG